MLTIADGGGTGGGGVQEPLILADVICEQPLKSYAEVLFTPFQAQLNCDIPFEKVRAVKKQTVHRNV